MKEGCYLPNLLHKLRFCQNWRIVIFFNGHYTSKLSSICCKWQPGFTPTTKRKKVVLSIICQEIKYFKRLNMSRPLLIQQSPSYALNGSQVQSIESFNPPKKGLDNSFNTFWLKNLKNGNAKKLFFCHLGALGF